MECVNPLLGRVVAVRGTVVDAEFASGIPPLGAVLTSRRDDGSEITSVVHSHIDETTVRAISVDPTRGLRRGAEAHYRGPAISVPVGDSVLGRVVNVKGAAIDGKADPQSDVKWSIQRRPPQPSARRSSGDIYVTGIKVIDLICPFTHGGRAAVFGGAGVGKTIILTEFIRHAVEKLHGVAVFAGIGERSREGLELWEEMRSRDVMDRVTMVFGQMKEPPGARFLVGQTAMTIAEYFRDVESKDVLFIVDNLYRHVQAGMEVSGLLGRLPSRVGYQPTLAADIAELEERITATKNGGMISVQAIYVPADDYSDPAITHVFWHMDSSLVLSRDIASEGLYPAVDPLASASKALDVAVVGQRHYDVTQSARQLLGRYEELRDIISMLGLEELSADDQVAVKRARMLRNFLTQPLFVTEAFTGMPGRNVPIEDTIAGVESIINGDCDAIPEDKFYMIGSLREIDNHG